jgi:hypothetical protein
LQKTALVLTPVDSEFQQVGTLVASMRQMDAAIAYLSSGKSHRQAGSCAIARLPTQP